MFRFQNGSFLVRESRTPGDYSLTVKLSSSRIEHYKEWRYNHHVDVTSEM